MDRLKYFLTRCDILALHLLYISVAINVVLITVQQRITIWKTIYNIASALLEMFFVLFQKSLRGALHDRQPSPIGTVHQAAAEV